MVNFCFNKFLSASERALNEKVGCGSVCEYVALGFLFITKVLNSLEMLNLTGRLSKTAAQVYHSNRELKRIVCNGLFLFAA